MSDTQQMVFLLLWEVIWLSPSSTLSEELQKLHFIFIGYMCNSGAEIQIDFLFLGHILLKLLT